MTTLRRLACGFGWACLPAALSLLLGLLLALRAYPWMGLLGLGLAIALRMARRSTPLPTRSPMPATWRSGVTVGILSAESLLGFVMGLRAGVSAVLPPSGLGLLALFVLIAAALSSTGSGGSGINAARHLV